MWRRFVWPFLLKEKNEKQRKSEKNGRRNMGQAEKDSVTN